ncbi:NTP transferase domain-containing protein [Acetatifactor aquisgranensis]|uniref:NTP transferase domain-containing protein n=1 Tax=Acetatifactor aquisgranensis TaxID=2941233 RepID=UPI00203DE85C|nr:NTP transferase domain-containing protein [Acetatifactor aquisgranensis]
MSISRTVIISCAGMGNRLGLGATKALVEIEGKPLIVRHLEMLKDEKDIRIVVGYQSQKVIHLVRQYRNDVTFVFNHDYRTTGTGASVALASRYANEFILSLDGDILVHPDDMNTVLAHPNEFIGGSIVETDDPWMLQTYEEKGKEFVCAFSKNDGKWEWNGITQMKSVKVQHGNGHVFQLIEPYLPIPFLKLRTKEIDTINDYERATAWVRSGFRQ